MRDSSFGGLDQRNGSVRIVAPACGPLSFVKGTELGGAELAGNISIVPGKGILIDGLSSSRCKKANNLVLIDADSGAVNDMVYVGWKRSAIVEPAHLLLAKRP